MNKRYRMHCNIRSGYHKVDREDFKTSGSFINLYNIAFMVWKYRKN